MVITMYTCVYAHVHLCKHEYIYMHTFTAQHVGSHDACIYKHTCTNTHIPAHTYFYTLTNTLTHTQTHIQVHRHAHTNIPSYTHKHIHT